MEPIYNAISWILLRWHWVWDHILPNGQFLGTTWDWVLAIVFLVITVRIILFPIFVKQIRSQRAMQALAPKVKELQAKHKGDQQTLREEMMKLYQTEKVNPLMGCLPLLLQIPVFFGLFHTLRYINPFEINKTQYGWTVDQFNSASVARLFTAPIAATFADGHDKLALLGSHGVAVKVVAGVLVLIMMLTTFMTSRQMILKTGWSQDPQQRMIQKLMLYGIPFSLLLSGWYFPIGVIIYWVTQNIFSLGQQYWVLHKYPPPVMEGSTAAKSARERAAAANQKEPGVLARFFQVKPAAPKTAGFVGSGEQPKAGFFRRRPEAIPPAAPEPRSLAPRPGAKPKAAPSTPQPPSTPSSSNGATAESASAAADGTPTKSTGQKATPAKGSGATKSTPARSTPAKGPAVKSAPAKGSTGGGSSVSGASANGSSPNGASANGSPGGASGAVAKTDGTSASSTSGSSNGSRPRPTTKKTGATPRKGQPNRKGGAKR
jgi:YidC/Oxa1 family membrane protein insertase